MKLIDLQIASLLPLILF